MKVCSVALILISFGPLVGQAAAQDTPPVEQKSKRTLSISDPLTPEERITPVEKRVTPAQVAAKAFAPPPSAKQISKRNLWVDRSKSFVFADGYVAMTDGPLEMFACPTGTKEHESVVATIAQSKEVHAALLAVGAKTGTPVRFSPRFVPATGQKIRVWVCYRDQDGKFQVIDARKWIRKSGTEQTMDVDWVFGGSFVWNDPTDGRDYYQADSGDMICVSNFGTAMLDVPVASSAEASDLLYSPMTPKIPPRGTPVRLVLVPIPFATDANPNPEAPKPPGEDVLPAPEQEREQKQKREQEQKPSEPPKPDR